MSDKKKEFISDKTMLIWIMVSAVSTIIFLLITTFIAYLIFDCWIMFQHQLAGGSCGPGVNLLKIISIPVTLGFVTGALLTRKIVREDPE